LEISWFPPGYLKIQNMPTGLFHTVLEGDSFWSRLRNAFTDRNGIAGPDGRLIGFVKLYGLSGPNLWDVEIDGQQLHIPRHCFNSLDYPIEIEVMSNEDLFATLKSGVSTMDNFHLEFEGVSYLWKDVSKVKRVMELQLENETYARAHSKGVLMNHTFIDVRQELPTPLIGLLFPMYKGFFNSTPVTS
jgi:hypothetical protein